MALDGITGQQRGYDTSQTDEEKLVEQQNLNQQNRDNLPAYPHTESEPAETPAEHATEKTIGREIRPAPHREPRSAPRPRRQSMPVVIQPERALPRHMMDMRIPDLTRAGAMMDKPAPRMSIDAPALTRNIPMRFDVPKMTPPKHSRLDPFRGIDGNHKKKKVRALPKGMRMFGTKGTRKRGIW